MKNLVWSLAWKEPCLAQFRDSLSYSTKDKMAGLQVMNLDKMHHSFKG